MLWAGAPAASGTSTTAPAFSVASSGPPLSSANWSNTTRPTPARSPATWPRNGKSAPTGRSIPSRCTRPTGMTGLPLPPMTWCSPSDRIVEPGAIRSRTAALRPFYERETARAIDPQTVEVPLKFPAATFLTNIAVDY
ncbi:hypothetical protein GBAR_LOCUS26294, partial [Geodia barretti]